MIKANTKVDYQTILACPACRHDVAYSKDKVTCQHCQQTYECVDGIPVMVTKKLDNASSHKTESAWSDAWDQMEKIDIDKIEDDRPYADALKHIRSHAPEKWQVFLESGCGDARKSLVLAREFDITVVGIDSSLAACRRAKALFAQAGVSGLFVVGDLRCLPLKDQSIDYIYAGGSMEHYPETALSVEEAFRVLRPSGKITSTVPVISLATLSYAQLWGNIPEWPIIQPLAEWIHMRLLRGRHMKYGYEKSFSLPAFKRYFIRAGFEQVSGDQFKTYMGFQFIPWNWLKKLARALSQLKWFWAVIYVDGTRGSSGVSSKKS